VKRWSSIAAVVALCLALVIGAACGGGEEEVKRVKLGFAAPMSGMLGAFVGLPARQGINLASEMIGEFTVAGERYRWKVISMDNGYTTAGGVATATKFIFEDGVKFMHQTGADAALAAQPICEEKGVMLSISGAGMEAFGPDKHHTFQFSPTYMVHTPVLFQWLTAAHPEVKTVAIAMGEDRTGHEIADAAVAAAEYSGLEVVTVDYYSLQTMEFYPVATSLVSKEPDFFIGNPLILKAMREIGWDGLAAFHGWSRVTAAQAGWDNVQGLLVYQPNPFGEELPQEVKDFAAEYQARYEGQEFTMSSYYSATILYVMTEALKKAGTVDDVDKIMDVLETETFDTWLGPLSFGGQGLIGSDNLLMWPAPIAEISDHDYHMIFGMLADEAEALAVEVYK
jgi:ABC-type branched-subunit amino acid transport system substrate-binding protein